MTIYRESDLTPWFAGATHKPARPGVYVTPGFSNGRMEFRLWDGKQWMQPALEPKVAAVVRHPSAYQSWRWRGLRRPA